MLTSTAVSAGLLLVLFAIWHVFHFAVGIELDEVGHNLVLADTQLVVKQPSAVGWVFGYGLQDGPSIWYKSFSDCGGDYQSPVNLDTISSPTLHHPHLFWWNYNLKPDTMTMTNNGHTVLITGVWNNETDTPYYWHSTGNPSEENYKFEQLHFHWGSNDTVGSEHTINGQRYPLEMHVVHYKRRLSDMSEAMTQTGGLRVVGLVFMISEHENVALRPIVSALRSIREKDTSTEIDPFELRRILPSFSKFFMTYNGSLTSPPCAETVNWVVRLEPSTISEEQMNEFRLLKGLHGPLVDNFRPVQPLNGREVYHIR